MRFLIFVYLLFSNLAFAQLSGTYTIPGDYPSINAAVSALNAAGVSGNVVFNIAAGYVENAPVGGVVLQYAPAVPLANQSSLLQQVRFQKSGLGANPIILAFTGTQDISSTTSFDGIVKIVGADYITFDAINLSEIPSNTTATTKMEMGYGLLRASNTNGTQNCQITNCIVSLSASHTGFWAGASGGFGSVGIYSGPITNASTTVLGTAGASSDGTNSANLFTSNSLTSLAVGVVLKGLADVTAPFDLYDQNCTVGSVGSGNAVTNFSYSAVLAVYQNNPVVSSNSIDNLAGGGSASLSGIYGIRLEGSVDSSPTISGNAISLRAGAYTGDCTAIYDAVSGTGTVSIYSNVLSLSGGTTISSVNFYGIYRPNGSGALSNLIVDSNVFYQIDVAYTFSGTQGVLYLFNNNSNEITNTTFTNNITSGASLPFVNVNTGSSTCSVYGYVNSSAAGLTGTTTISNNSFTQFNVGACNTFYLFNESQGPVSNSRNKTFSNNLISDITSAGGIFLGISSSKGGGLSTIENNLVMNINGPSTIWGTNISTNSNVLIQNNIFTNFSAIAQYKGIYVSSNSYGSIIGNAVFSCTAVNNTACHGILTENSAGTVSISNNFIYSLFSTGVPTVAIVGIEANTNGTAGLIHNISNNLVAEIATNPASSSTLCPAVIGISCRRGVQNVYHNTVALGYDSPLAAASGNFGVIGLMYAGITGSLDLRNNILYVNALARGTGTVSALARAAGTSGTAPANFASSSNFNIYYSPNVPNSYLYSEGLLVSTVVNAYNLSNDPMFNSVAACSAYKSFMTTANEDSTATELPPFTGLGLMLTKYSLTDGALSYAESGAELLASYAIDVDGGARPNNLISNRPDIGFNEFIGVKNDFLPCLPLPIRLGAFNASCSKGEALFKWTSLSEENSLFYDLQASTDGVDWVSLENISAAGSSSLPVNYAVSVYANYSFYRLKLVCAETIQYSETISLDCDENADPNAVSVYPNPTKGLIWIELEGEIASLTLCNGLGQVWELKPSKLVDISGYAPGVYYLRIETDRDVFVQKLLKQD